MFVDSSSSPRFWHSFLVIVVNMDDVVVVWVVVMVSEIDVIIFLDGDSE